MGRYKKVKFDYYIEYPNEIHMLRDGMSIRRVRNLTGRAINTLRKLRKMFVLDYFL